ncbi:uncharacterized protein LOC130050668 [Ostrea edulis]|uniref:uncharacterized protein LOC130050668 n=1 Tax=Ostrea edulis TaxID=37623 RepID=UPI0024AEE47A|nr:uncharacterized protein LOC130050668 [Ostrea edulis]
MTTSVAWMVLFWLRLKSTTKRIDVACPASEDASDFYKRLGLDILATSSTSRQSEEAEQPRKRAVPNIRPTYRHDRVVSKWSQPQQTVRQFRNSGISESVATAAVYEKQHDHPFDHRQHYHDQKKEVANGGPKYQPQHHPHGYMHHTYGRSEDTRQRAQPAPTQQRVVKKEPQVKPINRYAPPEYITLQYHPTPTLEDLGLTSYLDSPPSSPRATSSDQDLGHVSTSASIITRRAERPQAISVCETIYNIRCIPLMAFSEWGFKVQIKPTEV